MARGDGRERGQEPAEVGPGEPTGDTRPRSTRTGLLWVATAVALVLLVLLIIFILQNQEYVQVHWLGLQGSVPLGMALFIAAVAGGVVVAITAAARVTQLRMNERRSRRRSSRS